MHGMDLIRGRRGLISEIARGLGIHRSAVSMWKRIPAERVSEVERISGIPRYDLRPDLWSRPENASTAPREAA